MLKFVVFLEFCSGSSFELDCFGTRRLGKRDGFANRVVQKREVLQFGSISDEI